MTKDHYQIGSDGTLERYSDPYKEVTAEHVERAQRLEQDILHGKALIEAAYLKVGKALDEFERDRLYLAVGYPTFRSWADGEIGLTYRTAHDLIRITRELLPLAVEAGVLADAADLGVAKMRMLLPVLADEDGQEKALALIPEIAPLASRDAERHIKEARGIARPLEEGQPAIFKAHVRQGESFHTLRVVCADGLDYYEVGTLRIKPKHFARWADRFGAFIDHEGL